MKSRCHISNKSKAAKLLEKAINKLPKIPYNCKESHIKIEK